MKVNLTNEVMTIEDGTYRAVISEVFEYIKDHICMKFTLIDDLDNRVLVSFYSENELNKKPWRTVFKALDTNDTDNLVNHTVDIEVVNNKSKKTGKEFCNIKNVTVIE